MINFRNIETYQLIYKTNQMSIFCMKRISASNEINKKKTMIHDLEFKIGDKTVLSNNFAQKFLRLLRFKYSFPPLPVK